MVLPSRVETLEDWLAAPVDARCADERFEVRRATPADYPQIFDLLDEAFGRTRPRAFSDWLYRRNPCGEARCWITLERDSGELVASETRWPWPFARGAEAMRGEMIGDAAVTPRLQRQDVGDLRAPFRRAHPWYADTTAISWPNERSRRAAIKHGYGDRLFGPLPRAVLPLRAQPLLDARLSWAPVWARRALAVAGDGLLAAHRSRTVRTAKLAVHRVGRFDAPFDRVTDTCMARPEYWSPHAADFLNWRYLDHPGHEYVALAIHCGDEPFGYAVVRVDDTAILMELAAPDAEDDGRGALIAAACEVAREAGCDRIEVFATESWRHWPFLRRMGFATRSSEWWVQARGPVERPISAWQLLPGDTDVL